MQNEFYYQSEKPVSKVFLIWAEGFAHRSLAHTEELAFVMGTVLSSFTVTMCLSAEFGSKYQVLLFLVMALELVLMFPQKCRCNGTAVPPQTRRLIAATVLASIVMLVGGMLMGIIGKCLALHDHHMRVFSFAIMMLSGVPAMIPLILSIVLSMVPKPNQVEPI